MRLTLAAAILVESSITHASSSLYDHVKKKADFLVSKDDPSGARGRHAVLSGFHDRDAYAEEDTTSELKDISGSFSNLPLIKSMLKNSRLHKSNLAECDPYISADMSIPDEGILSSCGPSQYCVESLESALGGFCSGTPDEEDIAHRHLQNALLFEQILSLCEQDKTDPRISCSTCEADPSTYTASVDCTVASFDMYVSGTCQFYPWYKFSGGSTAKGQITSPSSSTREKCRSIQTPIQFNYCINTSNNNGDLSCAMTINGFTCTSCEAYVDNLRQRYCYTFDCTNADSRLSGNSCDSDIIFSDGGMSILNHPYNIIYAAAFAYVYDQTLPCEGGCNLCGDGSYMEYPQNYFTTEHGQTLKCIDQQLSALKGSPYTCDLFAEAAQQGLCGCGMPPRSAAPTTPVAVGSNVPVAAPVADVSPTPVPAPMATTPPTGGSAFPNSPAPVSVGSNAPVTAPVPAVLPASLPLVISPSPLHPKVAVQCQFLLQLWFPSWELLLPLP